MFAAIAAAAFVTMGLGIAYAVRRRRSNELRACDFCHQMKELEVRLDLAIASKDGVQLGTKRFEACEECGNAVLDELALAARTAAHVPDEHERLYLMDAIDEKDFAARMGLSGGSTG